MTIENRERTDRISTLAEGAFLENRLERKGHFFVGPSFLEGSFSFSFSFPFLGARAFLLLPLVGASSSSSRSSQFSTGLSRVTPEILMASKAVKELKIMIT